MRYQTFFVSLVSKGLQVIFRFVDFYIPFVLVTTVHLSPALGVLLYPPPEENHAFYTKELWTISTDYKILCLEESATLI